MINSAKQFIELVDNGTVESLIKSKYVVISDEICHDIIDKYPEVISKIIFIRMT